MADDVAIGDDRPSAEPTKEFFVEMLTKDIPLEQAILDLVDNCVDGAKAVLAATGSPFSERQITITLDGDHFRIVDNCGGFGRETAINYAFRFGRPAGFPRTTNSIGQFGVGMKRALFKFGRDFTVSSATADDAWSISVKVLDWLDTKDWHFPWSDPPEDTVIGKDKPGTDIRVQQLRPEVAARFRSQNFTSAIYGLVKSKHRQFISQGLNITVNGKVVDATNLNLLVRDDLKPGRDLLLFQAEGEADVTARIIVGLGDSLPKEAGWYVVCNGRVILEADRSESTGWGLAEEASTRLFLPNFHNQYARFRGIVWFDSDDSRRVPWNTTKTDVDHDSIVWRKTFERMLEMTRPVMAFLNELDRDIDEHTRENSALLQHVARAETVKAERTDVKVDFVAPKREVVARGPRTVKIQYSKPITEVELLQEELGLSSARAVGEKSFELILKRFSE